MSIPTVEQATEQCTASITYVYSSQGQTI